MRRLFYWGAATLLLAAVVHLFVVIFVPGVDSGQKMARLAAAGEVNKLHPVSSTAAEQGLLTEPSPDMVYAFCKFDIGSRPLIIRGNIPPSYWSVSLYSETGDNVYTLNDKQAGVETIRLMVVTSDEAFEREGRPENTIIVRSPSTTGLVLFRAFVPDQSQAAAIAGHLNASECKPRPVKSAQRN